MDEQGHLTTKDRHPIGVASADGSRDGPKLPSSVTGYAFVDMASDFEFFTPALITVAGGFDRDIVSEFVKHHPGPTDDTDPFALDYPPVPFFDGIGIYPHPPRDGELVDWNRRIYAIPRDRWFLCRDFILGVAFTNPNEKVYCRLAAYELNLIDPIKMQKAGLLVEIPRFPVTVFAVSSTKRFSYLDPERNGPPALIHTAPRPDTILEGRQAGIQEPDPHGLHAYKKRRPKS